MVMKFGNAMRFDAYFVVPPKEKKALGIKRTM